MQEIRDNVKNRISQLQAQVEDPDIFDTIKIKGKLEAYKEMLVFIDNLDNDDERCNCHLHQDEVDDDMFIEQQKQEVKKPRVSTLIRGTNQQEADEFNQILRDCDIEFREIYSDYHHSTFIHSLSAYAYKGLKEIRIFKAMHLGDKE